MAIETSLSESSTAFIIGIDLAWGEKRPDGLCLIHATRECSKIIETKLTFGDAELLKWLEQHVPDFESALLCVDAPLIIPNASSCRPVEKQISKEFGKYDAYCHSSNSTRCVRPLRVARLLQQLGYTLGHDLAISSRIATEVYPHPAMIRLFELDKIIKYKNGFIETRKLEFKRLQTLLKKSLQVHFRELEISQQVETLLDTDLSKASEDQTDALFCALLGYMHWRQRGHLSKIVGSLEEGFILLPPRFRNGFVLMEGSSKQIVTTEMVKRLEQEDEDGGASLYRETSVARDSDGYH